MNNAINFTIGFTEGIGWHWPIAIYLLLAGISGGSIIIALGIKYYKKQTDITPLYKSASLIAAVSIMLGMVFLVGDLERPLVFWKILINYNFSSVMSIGVAALLVYIPLTCLMVVYAFENFIKTKIKILTHIIKLLKTVQVFVETMTFIFGIIICAYTGFLISILVRFPLLNTSILPALFVVSGLSVGVASLSIITKRFFQADIHSPDMRLLHKIEWPIMGIELLMLLMLYASLVVGGESGKFALQAFNIGIWSKVFWFAIIGVGFVVPVLLNFGFGKKVATSLSTFYLSAIASFIGVFSLRLFLLYAGQIFSV